MDRSSCLKERKNDNEVEIIIDVEVSDQRKSDVNKENTTNKKNDLSFHDELF